jgi:hypothetical protein
MQVTFEHSCHLSDVLFKSPARSELLHTRVCGAICSDIMMKKSEQMERVSCVFILTLPPSRLDWTNENALDVGRRKPQLFEVD